MAKVTLETSNPRVPQRSFPKEVAVRLLNYPGGSWKLPEGSKYEFKDGKITTRRNPTKPDKAESAENADQSGAES